MRKNQKSSEQRPPREVVLFVDKKMVKSGTMEAGACFALITMLRVAREETDENEQRAATIKLVVDGEDAITLDVSHDVLSVLRKFTRARLIVAEQSRPAAPRPDPAKEREAREQQLWAMAKQMYKDGFGQKPNANTCSVEGCTDTCRGTKDGGPQIAVDATNKEWSICKDHFEAGRFVDQLGTETERQLDAASAREDNPATLRLNKVMTRLNELGVPIQVYTNAAAFQRTKPQGAMAQALRASGAKAVVQTPGRGPAKQAAKPDQAPELTVSKAVVYLNNLLTKQPFGNFASSWWEKTDGGTWSGLGKHIEELPAPEGDGNRKILKRAKRAYAFLTTERTRETSGHDDGSSEPETVPGATNDGDSEVVLGVPEGAIIN